MSKTVPVIIIIIIQMTELTYMILILKIMY